MMSYGVSGRRVAPLQREGGRVLVRHRPLGDVDAQEAIRRHGPRPILLRGDVCLFARVGCALLTTCTTIANK